MTDSLTCPHTNKVRSRGWDHGFRQWICSDCDSVIDAPKRTELQKELFRNINRLLSELQEELRQELPVGLELHQKTLQIIRLKNYRNSAFDELGNWR